MNEELNDMKKLLHSIEKELRIVHNEVHKLKGNVRVFCRVRTLTMNVYKKALYISTRW